MAGLWGDKQSSSAWRRGEKKMTQVPCKWINTHSQITKVSRQQRAFPGRVSENTAKSRDPALNGLSWGLSVSYLDQFHHQEELGGGLHLLNQHDDVRMFHPAQDRHFVLNQMFLGKRVQRGGSDTTEQALFPSARGQHGLWSWACRSADKPHPGDRMETNRTSDSPRRARCAIWTVRHAPSCLFFIPNTLRAHDAVRAWASHPALCNAAGIAFPSQYHSEMKTACEEIWHTYGIQLPAL